MSLLNQLQAIVAKTNKRLGRGYGSGKGGHTASRGQKGQKSRTGSKIPLWFEGGQLPLVKRLPMLRGKDRLSVVRPVYEVRLDSLAKLTTDMISLDTLKLAKIIPEKAGRAKIIASGKLNRKLIIRGIKASKRAQSIIEKAGGKLV